MEKSLKDILTSALMIGAVAIAGSACGELRSRPNQEISQTNLQSKLTRGRRLSSPAGSPATRLGLLADDTIVDAKVDQAGVPQRLLFDTGRQRDRFNIENMMAAAKKIAEQHLLPFASAGWQLVSRTEKPRNLGDGLVQVAFSVIQDGVAVRDSSVEVYFNEMSDNSYAMSELFARHPVPPVPPVTRSFTESGLDVSLLDRLGLDAGRYQIIESRPVIYPEEQLLDQFTYEYAHEVVVKDTETAELITVTLSERDGGALLEAYSDRFAATSIEAMVYPRNYKQPAAAQPLPLAQVSDESSPIKLDALGQSAETVDGNRTIRLQSDRVKIGANQSYSLPVPFVEGKAMLAPTGNDLYAVNAYTAVQHVNSFVRHHLTESEAKILGRQVAVSINVKGSCNAFYTNSTVSLYQAGDGCANMAVVNDVIYHEWGHGLDDYTGTETGITDGAFSEGIGDILASYLVNDEEMAIGFFTNNDRGIRRLKNQLKFPGDRGEVHAEGQIIGGAFWDLREALIGRYGNVKGAYVAEQLFMRHLLTTDSYRDSYAAVVRLDDNDANPATPSPNLCLITAAFASHGLAKPILNCEDDPTLLGYVASEELVAGIIERNANSVKFMAAGESRTRAMKACFGPASKCLNLESADWQSLTLDGTIEERVAFVGEASSTSLSGTEIWLAAYDANDGLLGRRTLKIVER